MQLKRNKEMEFERLKKSHKKQIIIGALAICVIGGALTFNLTRAKYRLTQDLELAKGTINFKPYDFKIMAMYKSEDGINYTEINKTPGANYKINEEKSYCTSNNVDKDNNAKIYTDKHGQHVFNSLSKNDKCYVWFDKNTEIVSTILGNIEVNKYNPDFNQTAIMDEGIYAVSDGMYGGTSYYWRGATTTNYVKFANYCWRIIRINGDGSIRLIYDGTTCHQNGEETADSMAVLNLPYNTSNYLQSYIGWTYEENLQRPIDNLTATSSNAKTQLESWYNTNIKGINANSVAEGKYCNDRDAIDWIYQPTSYLIYSTHDRIITYQQPTLYCNSGDIYTLNVGLITANEVIYAGGAVDADSLAPYEINNQYYLYNGYGYWTMTTAISTINGKAAACVVFKEGSLGGWVVTNSQKFGLRPVVNLKSDVTISNGNGTIDNPYIVQ